MKGPLIEEMKNLIHEMRMGESRAQALKNLAERLELQSMTSFTRSIIQADQLGISLARVLRVQAQDLRNKRQMAAVPDGALHLPRDVHRDPRAGDDDPAADVLERRRGRVTGSARAVAR